ncbi:MAG: hypothetical protein JWN97_1443 [Nocardioides sp.]|nr:hypothetical protein [Nocardioides sp.]
MPPTDIELHQIGTLATGNRLLDRRRAALLTGRSADG